MNDTTALSCNVYAAIVMLIIYCAFRKSIDANAPSQKVFAHLLELTIILLLFDSLSYLDGVLQRPLPRLTQSSNFISFFIYPFLSWFWFKYMRLQIAQTDRQLTLWRHLAFSLCVTDAVFICVSAFFGWIYYYDKAHLYHRGPLFLLAILLPSLIILLSEVMLYSKRKYIDTQYLFTLLLFPIPPCIGLVCQLASYQFSFIACGTALSLLIIFVNIQSRSMDLDYLTGVYNRRKLDMRMQEQIHHARSNASFAALMIDIDAFKSINDTYGHSAGDDALGDAVGIMRRSLRSDDFIARYGGDEFCVIVNVQQEEALKKIIKRIRTELESFNNSNTRPYQLSFSIGYSIYDATRFLTLRDFQKHIDELMYVNKRR